MKKILVFTSVYPGEGAPSNFTPVVHYIVKEWVKMGYDVRVIHNCTYFPIFYYHAPSWLRRYLQNHGGRALPTARLSKNVVFNHEGVKVFRVAMKKLIPMGRYPSSVLTSACEAILGYLQKDSFTPDYIIAHWINPQLYMLNYFKSIYNVPTTMVLHDDGAKVTSLFKDWNKLIENVNVWGFRSRDIKKAFEHNFGRVKYGFRCFSGIPEYYNNKLPNRDGEFHYRFAQVGLLNAFKNPHVAIDAINSVFKLKDYSFQLIGDGPMRCQLESKIESLEIKGKVELCGRLKREEVLLCLDHADVFILISQHEAFGLAYIEAMARGCIVIASSGGGMDGIINDGINGFFCKPGSEEDLKKVLTRIEKLSNEERLSIILEAEKTAQLLSEELAAKNYIETIIKLSEESIKNNDSYQYCEYLSN